VKFDSVTAAARLQKASHAVSKHMLKRPYTNRGRREAALARAAQKKRCRSHCENGMDINRVQAILRRPACYCQKKCFKKFGLSTLMTFLGKYWSVPKADRDGLLALSMVPASSGSSSSKDVSTTRISVSFLGEHIGSPCLAVLLGHNHRKLQRAAHGLTDLRPLSRQPDPNKHGRFEAFFTTQYMSVAETLPTESTPQWLFLRSFAKVPTMIMRSTTKHPAVIFMF
jgi:hypothetical protein